MNDMSARDIWHIDPVTATVSLDAALIDPVIVVVESHPSLSVAIAEVCNFLRIRVERLATAAGIIQRLRDTQPIAVMTEAEDMNYQVYDLLMSVASYDPDLSLMVVLTDDPAARGALEAARDLWQLTDVVHSAKRPGIRALIDFLFHAGRKSGAGRLITV
jgi:hypothetical protein